MAVVPQALNPNGFGNTERRDGWWIAPFLTVLGLGTFAVYATYRAFQGEMYEWGPYLSPVCSPNLKHDFPELFGWWPFSPALLILWAPGGFRATCYYYRKAYYRSFFGTPPACSVGKANVLCDKYTGETKFPFVLQNLHRYFFYLAVLFMVFLTYDAIKAFFFADGFGVGVGSLVLTLNALLLGAYTFSCHTCRHLVGGNEDCFSKADCGGGKFKLWKFQTNFNERHMLLAWVSLFWVGFTDLYIYLLNLGVIQDIRFF